MTNHPTKAVLSPRVVTLGPRDKGWFNDALLASKAVRVVTDEEVRESLYFQDSLIPSGGWQPMLETAFEQVAELKHALDGRTVVHFVVPFDERPSGLNNLSRVLHLEKLLMEASEEAVDIDHWFNDWITGALDIRRGVKRLGVSANYAGMLTSTFDTKVSGKLVGLHLDSWDGTRLCDRRRSRYRACFNAGPEPRWFLFAPVALDVLAEAIYPGGFDDDAHFDPPASRLLHADAIRRVAALRLLPGEGYLAPTDALFHDGSTLWSSQSNINVQLLFDRDSLASA